MLLVAATCGDCGRELGGFVGVDARPAPWLRCVGCSNQAEADRRAKAAHDSRRASAETFTRRAPAAVGS